MVSVLAFYYDDLSWNPAEAYIFSVKICVLKEGKYIKKRPGWPIFFKKNKLFLSLCAKAFDLNQAN